MREIFHLQNGIHWALPMVYILVQVAVMSGLYVFSRKKQVIRSILLGYSLILASIYILWRSFGTIQDTFYAISIPLLLSEWLGYIQQVLFYALMWVAPKYKVPYQDSSGESFNPSVDIFVPIYNEPVDVLKRTLAGCTLIEYPIHKLHIYVLDDGNRKEVRQCTEDIQSVSPFELHYVARPTHEHAKAGNLNYALQHSSGDLVVTLDTDMVPKPNLLTETVPYFRDPMMGFVQAPQAFWNPDPFQYNLVSERDIPNEQDFFMRSIQAGKDRFDSVMYVGSNTVFSRKALEDIGGFVTGCITEDVVTGMLIQAKGYRSAFVPRVIAKGMAPESFGELLRQRERWCRGNLQAARRWNPLRIRGLSWMQRLLYLSGAMYWYFGVQKTIYILAPLLYLNFGLFSLKATLWSIAVFWAPSFVGNLLTFRAIAKGKRNTFWSHVYETAMAPLLAWFALSETLGIRQLKFRVTRKGLVQEKRHIVWPAFVPLAIFCGLTITGMTHAFLFEHANLSMLWISIFWSLYNFTGIFLGLFVSIDRPRLRKNERFYIEGLRCIVGKENVQSLAEVLDISETGIRVRLREMLSAHDAYHVTIPDVPGRIPVELIAQEADSDYMHVSFKYKDLSLQQYQALVSIIFGQNEQILAYKLSDHQGFLFTVSRGLKQFWPQKRNFRRRKEVRVHCHVPVKIYPAPNAQFFQEVASTGTLESTMAAEIVDASLTAIRLRLRVFHTLQPNIHIGDALVVEWSNGGNLTHREGTIYRMDLRGDYMDLVLLWPDQNGQRVRYLEWFSRLTGTTVLV